MQNQINLHRGDAAVFFEGMYYYYPPGHQMNTMPSMGSTFRQHQTKKFLPQTTRLVRNQVSLSTRTILPIVPLYWVDQLESKVGK